MKFKEACSLLKSIETEIKGIEFELWDRRRETFGIPRDQISDFGDLWSAEETTHYQANEKNRKIKRLKFLIQNRKDLFDCKFEKSCNDCEILIEKSRLLARPGATRCIHCQRFHEEETIAVISQDKAVA